MSSNVCFNVTIFRDGLYNPWGFRLEGELINLMKNTLIIFLRLKSDANF